MKYIVESDELMVVIPKDEYDLLREVKMMFNEVCDLYRRLLKDEVSKYDLDDELEDIVGELIKVEGELGGENE